MFRDKIENFIFSQKEPKNPTLVFLSILLIVLFIIAGMLYYIKINN